MADLVGWRFAFWTMAVLFAGAALMLHRSMRQASARGRSDGRLQRRTRRIHPAMPVAVHRPLGSDRDRHRDLEGICLFGAVALIASHLQRTFGVSPSVAGTVSALFGLGGMFYALNAGRLIARLRAPGLCRLGGGLIALAMVVLLSAASLAAGDPATLWRASATTCCTIRCRRRRRSCRCRPAVLPSPGLPAACGWARASACRGRRSRGTLWLLAGVRGDRRGAGGAGLRLRPRAEGARGPAAGCRRACWLNHSRMENSR